MRRLLRYLRIDFSATCLVACVLLIALWVRSYWWVDVANRSQYSITSMQGRLCVDESFDVLGNPVTRSPSFTLVNHFWGSAFETSGLTIRRRGTGLAIPYWSLLLPMAALAAAPWLRWRFSLRTLLIATTLVAVGLGLIVWAARQ